MSRLKLTKKIDKQTDRRVNMHKKGEKCTSSTRFNAIIYVHVKKTWMLNDTNFCLHPCFLNTQSHLNMQVAAPDSLYAAIKKPSPLHVTVMNTASLFLCCRCLPTPHLPTHSHMQTHTTSNSHLNPPPLPMWNPVSISTSLAVTARSLLSLNWRLLL